MKAGRGTPHGGVYLDIASRRSAEYIRKRLPSMYHQFRELAEVDITAEAMEVGPTCHYVMGGVEVDPDTEAARVPGLFAAGEVAGGMHGSNRLGGNSLSDLLVFGRRAGLAAAEHALTRIGRVELPDEALADAARAALAPFDHEGGENPYTVQHDLQQTMHDLVGIIRTAPEMEQALERIAALKERVANLSVEGHRQYNPGWHLALDLPHMLVVSECIARAALEREESRGGHTRDDFPATDDEWSRTNLICSRAPDGSVALTRQPLPGCRPSSPRSSSRERACEFRGAERRRERRAPARRKRERARELRRGRA
ncbi:FAD-binding protein [Blastococcus brunescens]|uniref:FAD-binding protein n=1 Tax=Blastococcus brunescens TaxID=1564165 RepID=A0ABZ1B227_9ACTN|nr:FAD-binding protein [Blastococcus sp. BMG 8361]WRL64875.1 FAD-binding protein [Blastococcus sp. BMG 8361]